VENKNSRNSTRMKTIDIYNEKGVVHPLVDFIRSHYKLNWREFGELLYKYQVEAGNPLINPINASLARRLSVSQASTYWFWGTIGDIGNEIWKRLRELKECPEDKKQVDMTVAPNFSYDLLAAYMFLHSYHECEDQCEELKATGLVLATIVVNELESYYSVTFPTIT